MKGHAPETDDLYDEERAAYIEFIGRLLCRLKLPKLKAVLDAVLKIVD